MMTSMVAERWSTSDVCAAAGATHRQVQYWHEQRWVTPEQAIRGNGYPCAWSFEDAVRAAVLVEVGLECTGAKARFAENLKLVGVLDGDLLVVEPYVAVRSEQEIVDLVRAHPCVSVVALGAIRARVRSRLGA